MSGIARPFLSGRSTAEPFHGPITGGNHEHTWSPVHAAGYGRRMAVIGLQEVVIDCNDPASLVEFWARVFGTEPVVRDETWAYIDAPSARIRIAFQRVPEAKTVKNRVHLDVEVDDIPAETERVIAARCARARAADGRRPGAVPGPARPRGQRVLPRGLVALQAGLQAALQAVVPGRPSIAGMMPMRPAWKSSIAWRISSRVFITNGP